MRCGRASTRIRWRVRTARLARSLCTINPRAAHRSARVHSRQPSKEAYPEQNSLCCSYFRLLFFNKCRDRRPWVDGVYMISERRATSVRPLCCPGLLFFHCSATRRVLLRKPSKTVCQSNIPIQICKLPLTIARVRYPYMHRSPDADKHPSPR